VAYLLIESKGFFNDGLTGDFSSTNSSDLDVEELSELLELSELSESEEVLEII
jgi:hypothetical protein